MFKFHSAIRSILVALLFCNLPLAAVAQSDLTLLNLPGGRVVQAYYHGQDIMVGRVDWEDRMIFAVGLGHAPTDAISATQARVRAEQAAYDVALSSMAELHQAVFPGMRTKIRHIELAEISQLDNGSVEVTIKMPMASALTP